MEEISGAKALLEALKKEKVDTIFGIPGGAILPIYDELYGSDIRHILCRHEQSAAHMADGYARATGRPGVCFATSGPGAANLVTGIATAYMDSSPVIAVTGQVPRAMIGKDSFQEIDIMGIATPITKHSFQPMKAGEIPMIVKAAFYIAATGRPGPVLIDVPKDVQTEKDHITFPNEVRLRGYNPHIPLRMDEVKKAVNILFEAEKPVILAGGGVKNSNAFEELRELSELMQAPVATTLMGKGVFPENHPLSLGVVGMHGTPEANRLTIEADVILAVGIRFSDRTTGNVEEFCADSKIIHIDIDEAEIEKNKYVDVAIVGDAREALKNIIEALKKDDIIGKNEWRERALAIKEYYKEDYMDEHPKLKPRLILKTLRRVLPEDSIITTEVGQNQMWAALHFKVFKPRTFISSGGLGTMGFGFPAAIGAKVAVPNVPVVDVAGDGSFCMTENSLSTAVAEEIPVIVLILNNGMLGMVAQWQRLFYNRRYSAVDLKRIPDFVKLAESYGAQGSRVQSIEEFRAAFKEAINSDVATVIDVPISPEENVLPMVPPGNTLKDLILS
ncbi:MAG: biosynthetic-type acetolactate synthase large subunit [Candidatus Bathyarchaeia archaeon]